ncbi:MAG: hypothetical protein A2057_12455 [Ignavibacteria bacterium GWA2_35_9]|nr:MAG: hypothetical protein A2057_12455 [Ignavibacteria bacterium GWA2_35_9]OGU47125.1 MAG: hypothetical protein A2000_05290 [Ignavibacteria bacterium GWB2_36_8]OGU49932.1 MAG: hypothetical protein A2080_11530 [Ignavibacteria bacterium GWC2_36_12]OGV04135.1 MAG: hypothetical protein A2330_11975 [Ignavibacteria bacterium RIFOXYB2_FULL_36_7]
MKQLWSKEKEIEFFIESRKFATPEQLFYVSDDKRYFAYWPKSYKGEKATLQSRNSLIGSFTEKYSVDLLQDFASKHNWFSVQGVVCEEIGLTQQSSADVAICKSKDIVQKAENILIIFEVKMSIVWNWELKLNKRKEEVICLGDFKSHQGNPGLLRSDSMLKAIGKSINIRVSDFAASPIPIIVLGNTPIMASYFKKVDFLKNAGIIHGFWSINPEPLDNNGENIKRTDNNGFIRMDSYSELEESLDKLISEPKEFFSSMKSKKELGRIIEIANKESDIEKKAEKFLELVRK